MAWDNGAPPAPGPIDRRRTLPQEVRVVGSVRSVAERAIRTWAGPGAEPDGAGGVFATGRRLLRQHPRVLDVSLAFVVFGVSTIWLALSPFFHPGPVVVQTALISPLAVRRRWPSSVFCLTGAIGLLQWGLDYPLLGDIAVLLALYTVSVHQSRLRAVTAAVGCEAGAILAAFRWNPAGTVPRSVLFLTATVVAALCAGLTVASGSRYLAWLDERARRLEVERDRQATIAANLERTRIARELHDIVSHSLSVVITLADAASLVARADPDRAGTTMAEVSEVGRTALADMRTMLGVLRDDASGPALAPQPDIGQIPELVERIRSTGLNVELLVEGIPFPVPPAVELTVFRLVQEALTNTLRHARAHWARVRIHYLSPAIEVEVVDDGDGLPVVAALRGAARPAPADSFGWRSDLGAGDPSGRGIEGMRERVGLHGGVLQVGPRPEGGWRVATSIRAEGGALPAGAER
jgi:signal transduction histidine kinase